MDLTNEAARSLANWRQSRDKQQSRPQASGEGGDRDDQPPALEQETADATAAGDPEHDNEPLPVELPSA
jgi:hypothetical protein